MAVFELGAAEIPQGRVQATGVIGFDERGDTDGDLLEIYILEEVQQIATECLWSYNNGRPNTGNGGMTPAQKLRMAA